MINQEYNGWKNWATWNFNLWINNSEHLYNLIHTGLRSLDKRENPNYKVNDEIVENFQIRCLQGVAKTIVGHEKLCPDLKQKDLKDIDFAEILEALHQDDELLTEVIEELNHE
mgnify:CR=1 FL=1|tara:strand:- start:2442 stop:2780 length:339 start_codon:yes stop_codon:yes gene_type:complete